MFLFHFRTHASIQSFSLKIRKGNTTTTKKLCTFDTHDDGSSWHNHTIFQFSLKLSSSAIFLVYSSAKEFAANQHFFFVSFGVCLLSSFRIKLSQNKRIWPLNTDYLSDLRWFTVIYTIFFIADGVFVICSTNLNKKQKFILILILNSFLL